MGLWGAIKKGAGTFVETAADAATGGLYSAGREAAGLGESSSLIDGGKDYILDKVGAGSLKNPLGTGGGGDLAGPSTANMGRDVEAIRGLREQYAAEMTAAGERGVPGVRTSYVVPENLGPAQQTQAAILPRVADVNAPHLGEIERAQAAQAMAANARAFEATGRDATAAQATAAQAQAAPVKYLGNTGRTTLGAAATADPGQLDQTRADQARTMQGEAAGFIKDAVTGKAPSVAELQLRDATNREVNRQNSIAASAGGKLSAASMRRQAAMNGARAVGDMNSQGALLRAKEIEGARGQYAGLSTDVRGQDLGAATAEMGERGTTNRFNAGETNTTGRMQGQLDQTRLLTDAERAQAAANMDAQLRTGVSQSNAGLTTGVNQSNAALTTGVNTGNADRTAAINTTNATLATGVSQGNAQRATDVSQSNAGLVTGVNQGNATAYNQRAVQAGQMQLDAATGNATRGMQQNIAGAGFEQDANIFNTGQNNARTLDQGRLNTDINTTNAGAFNTNERENAALQMQGRQLDDGRRSDLRGDALSAATGAAAGEQGQLDYKGQRTDKNREMTGNLLKSGAKAFSII